MDKNGSGTPLARHLGDGIRVSNNSTGATITDNVIGDSREDGIEFHSSRDGVVLRNRIGLTAGGAPLPNSGHGIRFTNTANNGRVGEPGGGNAIAHNLLSGIAVATPRFTTQTAGIAISANSIFANGRLGIDFEDFPENLGAPTPNDAGDADLGSNLRQNFPVLASADVPTGQIAGALNSNAGRNFRIEFFRSAAADPSGHGEGQVFLGAINVLTDAAGDAAIAFASPVALLGGSVITATATDLDGGNSTSEFSAAIPATGGGGFTDSDNDGMSDAFEQQHFGTPTGGIAGDDDDGDGRSNLEEFLALTNPKSGSSFFQAEIIAAGGTVTIRFQTEPGRIYQIGTNTDLGEFTPMGEPIIGDGSVAEVIHPNPGDRRFFQIEIRLVP
ncbi:MAG: right-handed parallel beta-helix repeat-containing protein [Verrucomicrobiales bacterium]